MDMDVLTPFDFLADLFRGEHERAARRHAEVVQLMRLTIPRVISQRASAVIPAAGTSCLLDLGGPSLGRRWDILRWTVSSQAGATATCAGQAYAYIGTPTDVGGSVSTLSDAPGGWVDNALTLPLPAFYEAGQVSAVYGERFYLIIINGTASAGYIVNAGIKDSLDAAEQMRDL